MQRMVPFQVMLDPEVKSWLKEESEQSGVPQAEIVRRILRATVEARLNPVQNGSNVI